MIASLWKLKTSSGMSTKELAVSKTTMYVPCLQGWLLALADIDNDPLGPGKPSFGFKLISQMRASSEGQTAVFVSTTHVFFLYHKLISTVLKINHNRKIFVKLTFVVGLTNKNINTKFTVLNIQTLDIYTYSQVLDIYTYSQVSVNLPIQPAWRHHTKKQQISIVWLLTWWHR